MYMYMYVVNTVDPSMSISHVSGHSECSLVKPHPPREKVVLYDDYTHIRAASTKGVHCSWASGSEPT